MRLRDEQGMIAIGVALMLIVVLSLFGGALWQYSMAELRRVERTEQDMQALFLARAGAEMVMEAWLGESVSTKPAGAMDRMYYDIDSKNFTKESSNYLGYIDVTVTKINDPDSDRHELTEIVATAVVQGSPRTVTMTTYPHLMGHDPSLAWYGENNGIIGFQSYDPVDELVVVRANQPIRFSKTSSSSNAQKVFRAPYILFESALDLGEDQVHTYRKTRLIDPPYSEHDLIISAETIFFDDLTLKEMTAEIWLANSPTVILRLPDENGGTPGSEIGGELGFNYGKVYFDGSTVSKTEFTGTRTDVKFLGFTYAYDYKITKGVTEELETLAGNAFWFKHGTDLLNIGDKDLILLDSEDSRADELKDLQPFVWE